MYSDDPRRKTIRLPSGDQIPLPAFFTMVRSFVPRQSTTCTLYGRVDVLKRIRVPSGDHAPGPAALASARSFVPSASITCTSGRRANAVQQEMRVPSGDHSGDRPGVFVS